MKRIKIYLESTVINNLVESHMPNEMADMLALWEKIKQGEYDVVLSDVMLNEIEVMKDKEKLSKLKSFISEIPHEMIFVDEEVAQIADEIAKSGIIPSDQKLNDRLHIGCALVTRADIIVSNNHDDILKASTIMGVKRLAIVEGYGFIEIFNPRQMVNHKGEI